MQLLIKQKVFSWTDQFEVYDQQGNLRYYVKGEAFSFTNQLHVYDSAMREVGTINRRMFSFMTTFDIDIDGQSVGTIIRKFSLFTPKYELEYKNWKVNGNFLGWDYEIVQDNCQVAHIQKEILTWGDTYGINILNPEDELMCLMVVLGIDVANSDDETVNAANNI